MKSLIALIVALSFAVIAEAQPIKAAAPGTYAVYDQVLIVNTDGTKTLAAVPLSLTQVGVAPVPPGPGPTPPGPGPVLNARAQAVLDSVQAITGDADKAKDAAGFSALLTQTKALIVQANIGDASLIGMTLNFALNQALKKLPAATATAWKPTTDLIGTQFNDQQKNDADAVLTVFDDAVAGLSAAAPGAALELPFQIDSKTGLVATGPDGKQVANPRYSATMAAEAGATPWLDIIMKLLPVILALIQQLMSCVPAWTLPLIASLV